MNVPMLLPHEVVDYLVAKKGIPLEDMQA